jgi:hypothetical protein
MPRLTDAERLALRNAILETANAVDDRVNATTVQQKLAARDRYVNGWVSALIVIFNAVKHGSQGDYE